MNTQRTDPLHPDETRWLKTYYYLRAAFSIAWVAAVIALGQHAASVMAVLLVVYPAWDAAANYLDASRSGGLGRNRTQAVNMLISVVTTIAVIVALQAGPKFVLEVFGAWAAVSGLLQLGTAVRRWKRYGAQWAMILSGAQSALAGAFFIVQAQAPEPPPLAKLAGYAGVGAVYFLISAVWLTVGGMRRKGAQAA